MRRVLHSATRASVAALGIGALLVGGLVAANPVSATAPVRASATSPKTLPKTFVPKSGFTVASPPTAAQVNESVLAGVEYMDCQQNESGDLTSNPDFGSVNDDTYETSALVIGFGVLSKNDISTLPTNVDNPSCPTPVGGSNHNLQTDLTNAMDWLLANQFSWTRTISGTISLSDNVQTITISAGASGDWTATWNGMTASALSPTITAAALQSALRSAWDDTSITVTGGPAGTGALAVTIPASDEAVTTTNPATSGTAAVGGYFQTIDISAGASGDWTATWNGLTASGLSPTITAAALQSALQSAWDDNAVTVTGGPGGTGALTVTTPGSSQLITATDPATSGTTTVSGPVDSAWTLTDTAGSFTNADVGLTVTGDNIPEGTTIASHTSSTSVTLSQSAIGSLTAGTVTLTAEGPDGGSWGVGPGNGSYTTYDTGLALAALGLNNGMPALKNKIASATAAGRDFLASDQQTTENGASCSTTPGTEDAESCGGGWNYTPGCCRTDESNTGYAETGLHVSGGLTPTEQEFELGWQENDQANKTNNPTYSCSGEGQESKGRTSSGRKRASAAPSAEVCHNDGGGSYEDQIVDDIGDAFSSNANDSGTLLYSLGYAGVPAQGCTATTPGGVTGCQRVDMALQFDTDVLDTYEKTANEDPTPGYETGPHTMVYHTGDNEDGSCAVGGASACDWSDDPGEGGFHYSMFTLSKGMGAYIPADLSDGSNWYAKVADLLVHQQDTTAVCTPDQSTPCLLGSWPFDGRDDGSSYVFASGLAVFSLGLVATPPPPVTKVTEVVASPHCDQIGFSWANPTTPNYGGVYIQESTTGYPATSSSGTRIADVKAPADSYTVTDLQDGTKYYFALFAHDTTGQAVAGGVDASAAPVCLPPPIKSVTAVTESTHCNTVSFTWVNPSPNYNGVYIQESTTGFPATDTSGTRIASVASPGDSYTATGLVPKKLYYFAFFAHDVTGKGVAKGVDKAAVPGCFPSPVYPGYRLEGGDGGVFSWRQTFYGSVPPPKVHGGLGIYINNAVAMAVTEKGGYWVVQSTGGVFSFGVPFFGSLPQQGKSVNDIVGAAATPDGRGYWLVASDGTVYPFGDATNLGSPTGVSNVVAIESPGTDGYWIVTANGGVYSYGAAPFHGACDTAGSGCHSVGDIVGIASQNAGGYWLVGRDGGVFAFGGVHYYGSCPQASSRCHGADDVVGIAATSQAAGYWLAEANGTVVNFGDAQLFGNCFAADSGCRSLTRPIVSITAGAAS
jgi:hypothetical protein